MLSVSKLTKDYGALRAVHEVSFEVLKGEVVGFLGPNGAGKSTTLRMITGFLSPSSGSVQIGGVDALLEPFKARRSFGYMPEGVPLYPELRVIEYLRHRAEIKGVAGKASKAAEAALERAGVKDAATRIIGQLSKGYRQRVGIADALLGDPPLLILDEPTSGLDPNQIRHVRELIRSFRGEKTVFLSTHILPEAEGVCERVIIVKQGRVVGEGTIDELRSRGTSQRIRVRARGNEQAYRDALSTLKDATVEGHVEGDGLVFRVALEGDDAAESVFRVVAEAGLTLTELQTEDASLEDVFTHLTLGDDAEKITEEENQDSEDEASS
ncbi:MAG: ABC-2 type transport system ATP-binding protein [Polyangiales bacterium]